MHTQNKHCATFKLYTKWLKDSVRFQVDVDGTAVPIIWLVDELEHSGREGGPLDGKWGEEEVERYAPESIATEKRHKKAESDKYHYMDILEYWEEEGRRERVGREEKRKVAGYFVQVTTATLTKGGFPPALCGLIIIYTHSQTRATTTRFLQTLLYLCNMPCHALRNNVSCRFTNNYVCRREWGDYRTEEQPSPWPIPTNGRMLISAN